MKTGIFSRLSTKRIRLPLQGDGGFTLVEIMIALLVFGVGIVGLANAFPNGMRTREKARRMSVATFLAKEEVERLRSLSFNHADLAGGAHTEPAAAGRTGYNRRWNVVDNNPLPGMKRLTVTVSFRSDSPDSQAIVVTQLTR
jgi:prepilin-type N-terminal cleavage/methylation domain-containing protein